jgi:hypothetical protein
VLAFNESNASEGWRVSRAQAVRVLSPGCLPCIYPSSDKLASAAHVERSDWSSSSGTATTNLRSCAVGVG